MRIDLHNHTIDYSSNKVIFKKDVDAIYTTKIIHKDLDYLAITNYHDIKNAILLQEKFPSYIIIGCEYLVVEKNFPMHIVCLSLTEDVHKTLMSAKLRGIDYFTSTLNDREIPFFLTRMGWGIPVSQEIAQKLHSYLKYFYAIDIANISIEQESMFSKKIALYYNLSVIGGSDTLVSQTEKKIYTESSATNLDDFYRDMRKAQTSIGMVRSPSPKQAISIWHKGKDLYRQHLYKISLSHFSSLSSEINTITQNFNSSLVPFLEFISETHHLYKLEKHMQKVAKLETLFVDYLKWQKTQDILKQDISLSEKQKMWQQSIKKINQCFC